MKLLFIIAEIIFLSCTKPKGNCDNVTFVKDVYLSGIISGYMYQKTDTIWKDQNYCDAELDSLLNIIPYDVVNLDSLKHYRYVFLNHKF